MESKDTVLLSNLKKTPVKIVADVIGSTSGALTYYCRPSFPCQLIEATLSTLTNSSGGSVTIAITKVTDATLAIPKNEITAGTNARIAAAVSAGTIAAVSTSAVANIASGTTASTVKSTVGANHVAQRAIVVSSKQAFLITIPQNTSAAIAGILSLELLPI